MIVTFSIKYGFDFENIVCVRECVCVRMHLFVWVHQCACVCDKMYLDVIMYPFKDEHNSSFCNQHVSS